MTAKTDEMLSDHRKMVNYIGPHVIEDGQRIALTEDGEAWAELFAAHDEDLGWDLYFITSEPEWVGLREIYEYFRREDMTSWEWRQQLVGEMARVKVGRAEEKLEQVRAASEAAKRGMLRGSRGCLPDAVEMLPLELTTAQAARVLGVCKDTVLKFKNDGLLEYRNAAPPSSSRPVYLFALDSVLALRTTYRAETPAPFQKPGGTRRACKGRRRYKHLRLSDN